MKWLINILKKLAKRKLFWVVVVVAVIIIILIIRSAAGPDIEYVTETVSKGDLTQTVSETGSVKAATDINLNFKGTGTIVEVNVSEGDEVQKDDVLARLDAGNLEIQVRQARANYNMALANYNKLIAGASKEDINVTEESTNNAFIAYENAQRDHEALVKKIEADLHAYEEAVKNAETSLQDTKNSFDQTILNSRDNLFNSLNSSLATADHALDIIEVVFTDQNLEGGFSVENFQARVSGEHYYDIAREELPRAEISFTQAKSSLAKEDIIKAATDVLQALDTTKKSLDNTFLALSASTTTFYFTDAQLNAYKATVKADQTALDGAITSVNTNYQSWTNSKLTFDSSVNTAEGSWQTAQKNLESALANKELQIANAKSALANALGAYNLAKAQLDLKKAPARSVDISYYQAQVDQVQAALDLSLKNLDDYLIYAPINGLITFVNYDVGEQIGVGLTTAETKPVISMLGKGAFEIEVDVPESDIIKVSLGDEVKVTLDAYGENEVFDGQVVFIDLAESLIQDVVYYKVTVAFEPSDLNIKTGMTANVDIITDKKENVIYIPNRAVKENEDGSKYVEILSFGSPKSVDITTGLRGDEGTEIKTGLKDNQEIIIYKREK
ncbi:efflux RND transporter periplasmic adaptor subunit [Patescibacteria group bacterium]